MRNSAIPVFAGLIACSGGQKQQAVSTPPPEPVVAEKVPDKAQTPSERLGPGEDVALIVKDQTLRPGSKFVVVLDDPVGPQFSREGQRVSGSVVPAKTEGNNPVVMPDGTKVLFRVGKVQPPQSGTTGVVTLIPRAMLFNELSYPIDARITAVGLEEKRAGGRAVNPTGARGADVSGSIVKPSELPPTDLERDYLGKGTAISVGDQPPNHQLDKGTPLVVELNGPVPIALWTQPAGSELALGWIREIRILDEELLGKRVELSNVKVESVIGDVVFWVGPSKQQRVLVVMDQFLDDPEAKTVVKQGNTVAVKGVVEAMPPKEIAPLLWAMVTEKEAKDFQPYRAYVYATSVKVTPEGKPTPKRKK